jgi:hypothetical protein
LIAGAIGVIVAPSWWQSLVPDALFPGGAMESVVLGKSQEEGRLLLKLGTAGGVLLATFTERVEEIDLLVEEGDQVTLRVAQYQPFLTDPKLDRVVKPEVVSKPPESTTTTTTEPTTTTAPSE